MEITNIVVSNTPHYLRNKLLSFVENEIHILETTSKKKGSKKLLSVLLVEDSPIIQTMHSLMLRDMGCYVDIAETGEKALQLSKNKYDIILMDVNLPDISGIEVTAKIRERERKNKRKVPIFALTTHSEQHIHQQCLDAGMDKVATKPISKDKLKRLVYQE